MLGTWEIILIVLVILLIFGGKKIPELMRGLGKGVKSFKDGMNGKEENEEKVESQKAKDVEKKSNSEQSERSNSETV
ncbi:MAG: twin-arginine translocase TatA/TatE family subunit [Paludibacteraceae bacterium]|nr:twin-arginine translocase TatA/TatE family subunit [Paludibacteraceae bacterium]